MKNNNLFIVYDISNEFDRNEVKLTSYKKNYEIFTYERLKKKSTLDL